ncbi:hypothetical protein P20652_1662 [Pseudoalteromonas sp. BSi20652]|nr:hypothetical protein P20652_1662 [Pseudoalteromonas sp. BSi20652]
MLKPGELNNEDVIYYFIFLSELVSTAKVLATNSTFENSSVLIDKIEMIVADLELPFKQLMSESRILKQFLQSDSIDQSAVEAILGWFKEQVDYTHG